MAKKGQCWEWLSLEPAAASLVDFINKNMRLCFNKIKKVDAGDTDVSVHGGKRVLSHTGWREEHQESSRGSDSLWHRLLGDLARCHLHFPSVCSSPCHRGWSSQTSFKCYGSPPSEGSAHFWASSGLVGRFLLLVPTQILLLVNIVQKKPNQTGEDQQWAAWLKPVVFAIWGSENHWVVIIF